MSTDTIITTAVANQISKMALNLDTLTGNAILRDLSPVEPAPSPPRLLISRWSSPTSSTPWSAPVSWTTSRSSSTMTR